MSVFSAVVRKTPEAIVEHLKAQGVHSLMARLFAARGIEDKEEIGGDLGDLIPPSELKYSEAAAHLISQALLSQQKILVVGDYDCDGATATAVAVGVLRSLGANVDYLIPNRLDHGYGVGLEIAKMVVERQPDLVITVDSGISDIAGVALIRAAGITVIITDHHLPSQTLPNAHVIINPNLPECYFPSKHLAGVGVIFYVMLQLRAVLRQRGFFETHREPNLAHYLDLVALGTVADMVRLDKNNRILVNEGLKRIRAGKAHPGLMSLLAVAGRKPHQATTEDLGFFVAPRLNAAGRLGDMKISIECLTATDMEEGKRTAELLDKLNRQRQSIQESMIDSADRLLDQQSDIKETLTLFHPEWHEGIIGIVAGRLKERFQKPVFVFAPASDHMIKGSGRSTAGIDLHAILVEINSRHPDLLKRFGGHKAAAGVTIDEAAFELFQDLFETIVIEILSGGTIKPTLESDGSLELSFCNAYTAALIEQQVWGQGFPTPVFVDHFDIEKIEAINGKHMRLHLNREGKRFEAVQFHSREVPENAKKIAYRLVTDRFRGQNNLKFQIEGWIE